MKMNRLRTVAAGFLFAGAAALTSAGMCADDQEHFKFYDESSYTATVTKEMNEMEALYKTAISKDVSQGKAEQARQDMVRKARHLLRHLNERNSHINIKEGGQLTSTEVLLNFRVMGRLLDILVSDALPHEDEWSYAW